MGNEEFIENLAKIVLRWTNEIKTTTNKKFDLKGNSLMDEINFWMSYERAINLIEAQLQSPEITLTVDILDSKGKHAVTSGFKFDL